MHKIDGAGATAQNTFTEGDPINGVKATQVTDDWLNAVQGEVVNAIEGAGITLNKENNSQLLAAIQAIAGGAKVVFGGDSVSGTYQLPDMSVGKVELVFYNRSGAGNTLAPAEGTYHLFVGNNSGTGTASVAGGGNITGSTGVNFIAIYRVS